MIHKILLTFRREGFSSVLKKAYYRVSYTLIRAFENSSNESIRWEKIKGTYKGKRVFLIGNGPSLNETPLYMLKDEYVLCFNRFYIMKERLNWKPNFYMCVDDLVLNDLAAEIEPIVKETKYAFFPDRHFRSKNFKKILPTLPNMYWLKPIFGQGFSNSLPDVNQGGSVIYEGMQAMHHLGFDEIILLGVDMNFKIHETAKTIGNKRGTNITSQDDDDPNHFDPRYFGKNRSYHQPKVHVIDNILKNLNFLGANLKRYGVNIINAGFNSKVESFPKKDFYSFFDKSQNEIKEIFEELLIEKTGKRLSEFEYEYPMVISEEALKKNDIRSSFYTSKKLGVVLVRKKIHTYLPLGPFDNKYYFVLRKSKIESNE
ncbi:MAG: hypothetical protein ACI93N_000135 [Flavobacteriaceae bacterium]|jgi:hypothetical protein